MIINYQRHAFDGGASIYDSKFWSKKTFEDFCFNDVVNLFLIQDIRKRIIINWQTGSSWRFNRFQSILISVNTIKNQSNLK